MNYQVPWEPGIQPVVGYCPEGYFYNITGYFPYGLVQPVFVYDTSNCGEFCYEENFAPLNYCCEGNKLYEQIIHEDDYPLNNNTIYIDDFKEEKDLKMSTVENVEKDIDRLVLDSNATNNSVKGNQNTNNSEKSDQRKNNRNGRRNQNRGRNQNDGLWRPDQGQKRQSSKVFYPTKSKNSNYAGSSRDTNTDSKSRNDYNKISTNHDCKQSQQSKGFSKSVSQNESSYQAPKSSSLETNPPHSNSKSQNRHNSGPNSGTYNNSRGRGNKTAHRNNYQHHAGFGNIEYNQYALYNREMSCINYGNPAPYLRGMGGHNRNNISRQNSYKGGANCNSSGDKNFLSMHWPKLSPQKESNSTTDRGSNHSKRSSKDSSDPLCLRSIQRTPNKEVKSIHSESSRSNSSKQNSACSNDSKLPEIKHPIILKRSPDDLCKPPCIFSSDTKNLQGKPLTSKEMINISQKTNELLVDVNSVLNNESLSSSSLQSRETSSWSKNSEPNTPLIKPEENKNVSKLSQPPKAKNTSDITVKKILKRNQDQKNKLISEEVPAGKSTSGGSNGNTNVKTDTNNKESTDTPNKNNSEEVGGKDSGDTKSNDKRGKPPNKDNNPKKRKRVKKEPQGFIYTIVLRLDDVFDDQAKYMVNQFEMIPRDMCKIDWLKRDLYRAWSPLIPEMEPVVFGSMVAATAFRNSDVDIFLKCYRGLPTGNVHDFILKHATTLYRGGLFKNIVKIASARVPIVKAVHSGTGISVDISFVLDSNEHHYGLTNSHLVRHLCSHDPRVRNLIMLVLFWAKHHGFVGKFQMSSFTFILMVVFYLQIVEILPPLYKLITFDKESKCWPTDFNRDVSLLHNTNTESLESLYLGFFTFFSAVRFDEVVISVYAGELVLGVLFETPDMLPDCYVGYRKLVEGGHEKPLTRNEMCIQEPFNMSWNTVRGVNDKIIDMLKHGCHNVCNTFTKFSSHRVLPVLHSDYQFAEEEEDSYSWQLPSPPEIESHDWFKKVIQATRTIFSSILLMDIHEGNKMFNENNFSTFYFSEKCEENPVRFIVSCEYLVASKERNKLVQAYKSTSHSEYEREIKASALYAETLKKKEKKSELDATLYIARNEKNGSTEITINNCANRRSQKKKQEHKQFVSYLRNDNFKHFLGLALGLVTCDKSEDNSTSRSEGSASIKTETDNTSPEPENLPIKS